MAENVAPEYAPSSVVTLEKGDVRLSWRALAFGFFFSMVMCGINSYLTLSFGVIEEGPTIAALFFFAFFFLLPNKITTTEMALVATMGSAGGSLGFISNFFAAKVMTGSGAYSFWEMAGFSIVTSLLGLAFVVPLRQLLVLKENLPWPGSRATESVIRALTTSGDRKQPLYLLVVGVLATAFVVLNDEDGFGWFASGWAIPFFGLSAYSAALAWSPFAIGGAYLMGFRTCVGFLAGGIVFLVMAPYLETPSAPHRYVWPGMGFLLSSGLTALALNWKVVVTSLGSLVSLRQHTEDDDPILSGRGFVALLAVALVVTTIFGVVVMGLNLILIVALVVVGGLIQNVIATRAAAMTAFNPARAMGVLLQGVSATLGGSSAAVNLTGAGFVAGSGAQAGNLTGDMVYGRWLKVPSRWQFWAQAATIIPCSLIAARVFTWINETSKLTLEGGLPAPVAKMWATTALIFDGSSQMPNFAMEAIGIGFAVGVFYVLLEQQPMLQRFMPSSVGLGLGLVLPVAYDFSFFFGGVLFLLAERVLKIRSVTLTTIAVACIVAEGIGGVLKPALHVAGLLPP